MALHMMKLRYAPDEPTSAPVMISRSLLSMKPAAAAAQPEYEFSIDTTTGMSPPPMEATRCRPSARAMTVMRMSSHGAGESTNHTVRPRNATTAPRLM